MQIVTLLTDFGVQDYFVGAVTGAILSSNAEVCIVNISLEENNQTFLLGSNRAREIRIEQAVKKVFACFASHRQAARLIGSRIQPSLHRFTDVQVFLLNAIADIDARQVALKGRLREVGKIKVEHDF
ncbi:MAG: hydroxide adenosyltransferase N-terminal domain, partial [Blastocatellia bacterium]|nr:hydroxide adenosyltransferase N-terminal domain [Blastocatellia bacterium]